LIALLGLAYWLKLGRGRCRGCQIMAPD